MRRLGLLVIGVLALALVLVVPTRPAVAAPGDWPTYHLDNTRSGNDLSEPAFNAVTSQWNSVALDGNVYAEPLVVGNTVYVATEGNSVYALNASSGAVLWRTNVGAPVTSGLPCGNINPLGITSTPVIDTANNILYAVAVLPPVHDVMVALNLSTGAILWQRTIDPAGMDTSVQGERGALALSGGMVYVPFGGRLGDCGNYFGWVVAVPASGTGTILSAKLTGRGGGIWAASGSAVDAAGNVLVATGNTFSSSTFDYGESVIKLSPTLAVLSYFAPSNWVPLNGGDTDLGSVGPALLGSGLIFQVGKAGDAYLLNQGNLGGIGGQAFTAHACPGLTADAAFGGTAYSAPYIYVPCVNGLVALNVITTPTASFTVAWQGPRVLTGPPIVAGGVVWTIERSGRLYGLDPTTGATRYNFNLGSAAMHFATPSAGGGRIFAAAGTQVHAFGNGGPAASLSPTSWNFGSQPVGTPSAAQTFTVTSSGTVDLHITTVTIGGTNAADFATSANTCANATLRVSQTCTVGVTFTPAATGSRSASLSITDDAPGSPQTAALSGTGTVGGPYHPLTPARILDTRTGTGGVPIAPLGPGGILNVQITGQGGVPSTGVSAVVLNVTVTDTTAASYLTVYPTGATRPLASNLNWVAGRTVPNLVEVALSSGGQVTAFNFAGSTDVVFDVAGYVSIPTGPVGPDGLFTSLPPARILDTRSGTGGFTTPVGAGSAIDVQVTGQGAVPATGVAGVVLNVTATNPSSGGYLTVFPTGTTRPLASNLNFTTGQTVPNRVIVKVGTGGKVTFYNFNGSTDVVADVGGWFTDASNPAATGSVFFGVTPVRILDTRAGIGPVGPGATLKQPVVGAVVPSAAKAVVMNVTVTNASAPSYLTVWPDGTARPVASDLNWVAGQTVPNLVIVQLGTGGVVDVYNFQGASDVVMDVVGWYS